MKPNPLLLQLACNVKVLSTPEQVFYLEIEVLCRSTCHIAPPCGADENGMIWARLTLN
jgi:hypothetical protein